MKKLLLLPVLGGVLFWAGFQSARDDDFYAMRKNFELFGSVYEQVVGSYMERVDPERFMRTGMDAMLETLDPWTDFLDEADNAAMQLSGQRGLGRIPINLGTRGGRVTVLAPDANTGAYRQGVLPGDVLVEVAGLRSDSLSVSDVFPLLAGEPGTTVGVTVDRPEVGLIDFQLKREAPRVQYVSFAERIPNTNTAFVRLDVFGPGAAFEIDSALEDIEEAGDELDAVILDLRDNPGGLVNEAVALVGLFVPKSTPVVSTRGRAPDSNRLYSTNDDPDWEKLKLLVLVNRGSASASEIVTGALQDLDRAVVVGEPTFGKGLVQVVRPLPYHTSLKLTYSRYFTPAGRGIRKDALEEDGRPMVEFRSTNGRVVREGNGIEPDLAVEAPEAGPLEESLIREAAYFRFANELAVSQGQAIMAASALSGRVELPAGTLAAFRSWLDQDGFAYISELDRQIDALASVAPGTSAAAIATLRADALRLKAEEFDDAGGRILSAIGDELASILLDPDERMRLALRSDGVVSDARQVLESDQYARLLRQ